MLSDEQKLLPCPFCGCDDIRESGDNGYGAFWCMCEDCGVNTSETGVKSQAEANERWNYRATPSAGLRGDAEDAARYRWLRDQKSFRIPIPHPAEPNLAYWGVYLIAGGSLDAAIDAAMKP